MRSLLAGMLALAAASILVIAPANAGASTITVTTAADSGAECTLRNAISAANNNAVSGACAAGQAAPVVDTIDFGDLGGQPITLGSTLPSLSSLLAITGPGASQLTISGDNLVQPFQVAGGTITISGLTIANGRCGTSCSQEGGAISENAGDLTLDSVSVIGNTAIAASAIPMNNFAEGGAIEVQAGSALHVVNSTISGNTVSAANASMQNGASAGAIMNRGTTTIDRSTISSNHATGASTPGASANVAGGAIDNDGLLTITRSTLSGNTVSGTGPSVSASGGGITEFNNPAIRLSIDRSTIANNSVTSSTAGAAGGGVYSIGFPGTITSSTISGNSAAGGANIAMAQKITFSNSIISNPLGGGPNCSAVGTSAGYNIESANSCGLNLASDHASTDPTLTALADNGGPTQTMAPQTTSLALDQGKAAVDETTDQRGVARPSDAPSIPNAAGGDGSDIGAYERDQIAPETTIDGGPDDGSTITDAAPTFGFSSSEPGSTFECVIDDAAFSGCSSTDLLSALADGPHTFAVRATDASQNVDATPATRSFTVQVPVAIAADTTPPETTITKAPKSKSSKSKAKYRFTSSEPNSTFECAFDSKTFKPCDSGKAKYKRLHLGKHRFTVVATDAAGNADLTPAKNKFRRKH
jgi:hypothetical protein